MSRAIEDRNRRMLRARDTIDRSFAAPLDVAALARVAQVSPAHFSAVVGESPSAYRERTRATRTPQYVPACLEKTLRRPVGAPRA